MRLQPVASGCLTLFFVGALLAACLRPEQSPAEDSGAKGHEETPQAAAAARVLPAPKVDHPAPGTAALPKVGTPLPGCRSIAERLASIVKAAPDAVLYQQFDDDLAGDYARSFNAVHGTRISADEVAIVVSAYWGDRALVLFERRGCETGTEQVTFAAQG